jgi:pimeloyl-ACP methyl ester carboxylesterase
MSLTVVFIPGYQSVVPSTKSTFLQKWCDEHHHRFVTFNHDFSSPDSNVGTWFHHLLSILHEKTGNDHLILIGASLGAWLALLILIRKDVNISIRTRICGILALGMSINGTEIWLNEIEPIEHRSDRTYIYRRPSSYSSTGYYDIPVSMLLDSKEYLLPIEGDSIDLQTTDCRLIFMHGMLDSDVPYQRMIDFVSRLRIDKKGAIEIRLVYDGDHRLSRDEDLNKIKRCLNDLIEMSMKQ